MKTALAFFFLGLFLCCFNKTEIWLSDTGSIMFNDNQITIKINLPGDTDGIYTSKKSYTVIEKMNDEFNKALSLYILRNNKDSMYTLLPEMNVNDSTRKYDLFSLSIQKSSRQEIIDNLNLPFKDKTEKYVFFGAALSAKEFKRN
jgi:hypothetical protein